MWIEQAVLSLLIQTGKMNEALQYGLEAEMFLEPNYNSVYREIYAYYRAMPTQGNVPPYKKIKERHPHFNVIEVHQDLKTLCFEMKERRLKSLISTACQDTSRALIENKRDVKDIFYALRDRVLRYQDLYTQSHDVTLETQFNSMYEKYQNLKQGGGVVGLPWPWPTLTIQSHGIQPGEFILIYGRQKSFKTWLMLHAAVEIYQRVRKRVLVTTWEMPPDQLLWRGAALLANTNYELWNRGQLPTTEENRVFQWLGFLKNYDRDKGDDKPTLIVTTTRGSDGRAGGVVSLRQKIEERKPDIVFVDGFYNMTDDRDKRQKASFKWTNQAEIVRDLQQLAIDLRIPIVASTQANRTGADPDVEGTEDVGFTDAAAAYCSYMMKTYTRQEGDGTDIYVRFKATRDFRFEGIKIHARPAEVFEETAAYKTNQEFNEAIGLVKNGNGKGKKGRSEADMMEELRKRNQ